MRTYCYNLDHDNDAVQGALTTIAETIPCFIWDEDGETYIECREEDAAYVERMIADFV